MFISIQPQHLVESHLLGFPGRIEAGRVVAGRLGFTHASFYGPDIVLRGNEPDRSLVVGTDRG